MLINVPQMWMNAVKVWITAIRTQFALTLMMGLCVLAESDTLGMELIVVVSYSSMFSLSLSLSLFLPHSALFFNYTFS